MKREVTRNHRWRCQQAGKWAYVTRRDARRAAKVNHPQDTQLTAYRCLYADHWHVGHVDVYARDHNRRTA
ncbi:MAG TPA: hypothetical protein VGL02_22305 [Streptomyces sp.]